MGEDERISFECYIDVICLMVEQGMGPTSELGTVSWTFGLMYFFPFFSNILSILQQGQNAGVTHC